MRIWPVEFVVGVVDCDAVGPLYLGGDDCWFVGSIHPNTPDEGFVSPVCPVDISNRNQKKVKLTPLLHIYENPVSINMCMTGKNIMASNMS